MFGQLDDIDREAMREGYAIFRLPKRTNRRVIVKKDDQKSIKKEPEIDILRILNIIQGK
jgi:hypothetical protein